MAIKLKNESNQNDCKVYVPDVIEGYPNNPPYENCEIVCGDNPAPKLKSKFVFRGTYEECVDFVKENCNS